MIYDDRRRLISAEANGFVVTDAIYRSYSTCDHVVALFHHLRKWVQTDESRNEALKHRPLQRNRAHLKEDQTLDTSVCTVRLKSVRNTWRFVVIVRHFSLFRRFFYLSRCAHKPPARDQCLMSPGCCDFSCCRVFWLRDHYLGGLVDAHSLLHVRITGNYGWKETTVRRKMGQHSYCVLCTTQYSRNAWHF